jgi:hypothetical protein
MLPFTIVRAHDGDAVLTVGEHEQRRCPSFAAAAEAVGLGALPPANVFDLAAHSGIATSLAFDGVIYLVAIAGGDAARVESFADAELWLARAIRAGFPTSEFARNF